jgi:hypothetical protein
MAITKTINLTDNFGEERIFNNSYIKVTHFEGDKDLVTFRAVFYTDASTKYSIKSKGYKYIPSLGGDNFIKQAYTHLKTLPEFAGAADI